MRYRTTPTKRTNRLTHGQSIEHTARQQRQEHKKSNLLPNAHMQGESSINKHHLHVTNLCWNTHTHTHTHRNQSNRTNEGSIYPKLIIYQELVVVVYCYLVCAYKRISGQASGVVHRTVEHHRRRKGKQGRGTDQTFVVVPKSFLRELERVRKRERESQVLLSDWSWKEEGNIQKRCRNQPSKVWHIMRFVS